MSKMYLLIDIYTYFGSYTIINYNYDALTTKYVKICINK